MSQLSLFSKGEKLDEERKDKNKPTFKNDGIGHVYVFIETDENGKFNGYFKIGKAENVDNRRKGCQTGNPRPLKVFYKRRLNRYSEAEVTLQYEMKYCRVNGREWFYGNESDLIRLREALDAMASRMPFKIFLDF